MSQARDLVDVLARALADEPGAVRVSEVEHRGTTLIEIYATPRDVGKMVGRQGRTIAAIRTLADVAARSSTRVNVEVRDEASE